MELIVCTKPRNILDVGVGFGKYGFLSREYLEIWRSHRIYRDDWEIRIDGIEAFKSYLTPVHDFIYDNIHIGNAIDILPTLKINYDLILLVDIIEHFTFEEGMKILNECRARTRNIIISTPINIGHQKDAFGNSFEIHKFQWRKEHFDKFAEKFFLCDRHSLICYIGWDALSIKWRLKSEKRLQLEAKIKYHFPFFLIPYKITKIIEAVVKFLYTFIRKGIIDRIVVVACKIKLKLGKLR